MGIRVLLVDDHAVLRAGLRALLEIQPDVEVVGEAADVSQAVARARKTRPDIVVLDLGLGEEDGLKAIPGIRQVSAGIRVLILTMHSSIAYVEAAVAAGASGYVVKSAGPGELLDALRRVARGERWFGHAPRSSRSGDPAGPPGTGTAALSARERQVFARVARGHTNREIAGQLGVSVKSVETYRARVMEKLGLKSRGALVRLAVESGVLESESP